MSALGEKLRRARESAVAASGFQFTVRRPTDMEAVSLSGMEGIDILARHVVGWNLSEIDLGVPGGNPEPAPFDADSFREWVQDQPEIFVDLARAVGEAYAAHVAKKAAAAKN